MTTRYDKLPRTQTRRHTAKRVIPLDAHPEILEAYEQGIQVKAIAKYHGVTVARIYQIIKEQQQA